MKTYKGSEPFVLPDFLKGMVVPIQPHLADEIRQATPDLNTIASLIMKDTGLSGEILNRMGGSVNGCADIWSAVHLLGIDAVMGVVNGLYLRSTLEKHPVDFLEDLGAVSYDTARASVLLIQALQLNCDAWNAYALGLLHHASMPMLLGRYKDYWNTIQHAYCVSGEPLTQTENNHYHTNHAVVSYLLAKRWNLPEAICIAIRDHHNISRLTFKTGSDNEEADLLLTVLKFAEHSCHAHQRLGHQGTDFEWEMIGEDVLARLGISWLDYQDLSHLLEEKVEFDSFSPFTEEDLKLHI
ncbi:HDOD domain-containing protein [Piscirickettsia litoralis]|uniref:HDOD domain-containing protein n=1 Tax=Piscirickettsia litoralis TaxID=1891921 RepID=A0ABX3AC71_9GAMM|nr:HDOD domain-containing protein [Piscirickettsia litoralis]ODN43739.1 hypothetical protein BGC07_13575 [Piscirickettsia litoralis]